MLWQCLWHYIWIIYLTWLCRKMHNIHGMRQKRPTNAISNENFMNTNGLHWINILVIRKPTPFLYIWNDGLNGYRFRMRNMNQMNFRIIIFVIFWFECILKHHQNLSVTFKIIIMTSSNGNIFRVTGHLCGEFTGLRWSPGHKGQLRGALMFSFICVWINGLINNREAGDLRRYRTHHDVTVMTKPVLIGRSLWIHPVVNKS